MLNMIRMELYRMFKTKSLYVIWIILCGVTLFTTSLTASEWKEYTMKDKQAMYEYAMGQEEEGEPVNLGMEVTPPTKPEEDISVYDMVFANIKGKMVALLMTIFAVLYVTADMTGGYIKNIAGQVKDRKGLVVAKAMSLFVYTVLTLLLFAAIQIAGNGLFFQKIVMGNVKDFLLYGALQVLLHFALLMIIMCIAILLRNNVISITIGVLLCMNALTILYGFIEKSITKMGFENFHIIDYTVTGRITMLNMGITKEAAMMSLSVGLTFVIVTVTLCSIVFQKRDI